MAEERNWSNLLGQEGIVNYPLAGLLTGTLAKGYQYQNQLTPYKREAKGDWARALDESLNQYFSQLPGYYQQVRANKLQQQQLAQQKIKQGQEQKMFDLKMQEVERAKKARESWPQTVAGLKLSDSAKKYLASLPYEQGIAQLTALMAQHFKPKARILSKEEAKKVNMPFGTQLLPNNELKPPSQAVIDFRNQKEIGPYTGELSPEMEELRPYLAQGKDGKPIKLFPEKFYEQKLQGVNVTPIAKLYKRFKLQDPKNWYKIKDFSDFIDLFPERANQDTKMAFVFNAGFPEDHPLKQQANLFFARKNTKLANDGSAIRFTPANPQTNQAQVPQPKGQRGIFIQGGEGITLDLLAKAEKERFPNIDIESWKNEVIGMNKGFFPTLDPNKMKASTDFEDNRKLKIPQLDSQNLSLGDAQRMQRELSENNSTTIDAGNNVLATITAPQLGTTKMIQEQRDNRQTALDQVDNIDEFSYLITQESSYNFAKLGANRGRIHAVMYRIIALVQEGRQFGVLTPSEMITLKESVPDVNTMENLFYRVINREGAEAFNQSVLQVLKAETLANMQKAEVNLEALGGQPTSYKQGLRDTLTFPDWRDYYKGGGGDNASSTRMAQRGFGDNVGDNETIVK